MLGYHSSIYIFIVCNIYTAGNILLTNENNNNNNSKNN